MANTQRLGSIWKGRAWDDGEVVTRVSQSDGSIAEGMAAMGYGWNGSAWVKLSVDGASGGLKVYTVNAGGGGGAVTVADGADVAEGTTTDVAVTSDAAGTLSGKLRGLVKILADVWDSANHRLKVDGSGVTQPVSGTFWQNTQPVSGTFWQSTQPVSGTVGVSNWPNTQTVAGTLTMDGNPVVIVHDPQLRRVLEECQLLLTEIRDREGSLLPPRLTNQ